MTPTGEALRPYPKIDFWIDIRRGEPPSEVRILTLSLTMMPPRVQEDQLESGIFWRWNTRFVTHWVWLPPGWVSM